MVDFILGWAYWSGSGAIREPPLHSCCFDRAGDRTNVSGLFVAFVGAVRELPLRRPLPSRLRVRYQSGAEIDQIDVATY